MPMTSISENPTSNMAARPRCAGLALLLVLDLAFVRLGARGADLAGLRRGGGLVGLHAVLEPLAGAAEVGRDVAQLLRAEDEQHDDEDDQPMPDAEGTHGNSPGAAGRSGPLFLHDHAGKRVRATEDVDVQMIHVLPSDPARVHDGAEA